MRPMASESAGTLIARRLAGRKHEIEQLTLARVYGIAEPPGTAELDYVHGLREAVSAAIDFGLQVLSGSDVRPPAVPAPLLVQARRAAHAGVALDVVLRRYFSGYTFFVNSVFEEMQKCSVSEIEGLTVRIQGKSSHFDRLVGAISDEYQREIQMLASTTPQLQTRLVERLLAGEVVDSAALAYMVNQTWHVALVIADSDGVVDLLRATADALDCRLLYVQRPTKTCWAWLGRRRNVDAEIVRRHLAEGPGRRTAIALGQPSRGLAGWRLSHRQAKAVFPLAQSRMSGVVSYAQSGLLVALARDEVLTASLRQLYIEPLSCGRDGGEGLKATLLAYLAAGRNITSAASALRLNRQTVRSRLRTIEEKVGRSLDDCAAEFEIALRLDRELPMTLGGARPAE
jgi:PucR C-terminal helix-turn-helix domain/GGDEF-like domain